MSNELTRRQLAAISRPEWSTKQIFDTFDYFNDICNYNSKVYFIGNAEEEKLKIGYSDDPMGRLNQLQTACPFKLSIYATIPGDRETEFKLHCRFTHLRQSGEWFYLDDELWALVRLAAFYDYAQLIPKAILKLKSEGKL